MRLAIVMLVGAAVTAFSGCCCGRSWCGGGQACAPQCAPGYAPTYAPTSYAVPTTTMQPVVCPPQPCNCYQ